MKILQCVGGDIDPAMGGHVEAARQLAHGLNRAGHCSDLLTLKQPTRSWNDEWPGSIISMGATRSTYLYTPRLTPWLQHHAQEYDAVIVHGLWRYISVGVWRVLQKSTTPYYVFAHGMLDPYYKLYRWKHVQKAICWALAEHRTVRDAAAVFFTSEEEMLRARNSFRPYSCKEAVVGLGIVTAPGDAAWDIEEFFTSFPDLRAKRLLLHLGRLHPKKGCDLLVRAFAEIARDNEDLHLVLAGPDECGMGSALKQLVRNLCPPASVTFTGPLSGSLKWGAFRAAEALVLPSHNENYGIVVVEALACGTPALISDQVAIWREVTEDSAGMADSDTLEGTIRLLRRWLALSLYERRVMQRAARTSFEKRYELSTSIRKLLAKLNEPSRSPQLLNTR